MEYITDEILDILDEFTEEEIADLCISIGKRLVHRDFCLGHLIKYGRPNRDYMYKVNNQYKGFVSLSDDCSTAVSRTEYYPFFSDDEDGYFAGLCSLADMINEAWYQINKED